MGSEIAIGMNQKDLLCDRKGRRAHVHPSRQEALLMRLSVDSLRRVVKRDLAIEFVPQQLTSFGVSNCCGVTCSDSSSPTGYGERVQRWAGITAARAWGC